MTNSTKSALLKNIAFTAYNIGFGGKKHLKTYDIYSNVPRIISICTIIIGIFQLLSWYKLVDLQTQEIVSALLISIGLISLVVDLNSDKKEEYEKVGKELLRLFNELSSMFLSVQHMPDNSDFSTQLNKLQQIEDRASEISKSKQALFTHLLAHFGFFVELQSKWVVNELQLKRKDKFPKFHWESCVLYLCILIIVYLLINYLKYLFFS